MIHSKKLYKCFYSFVKSDNFFSNEEKKRILEFFEKTHNRRIFQLSILLFLWSMIAVGIDSVLIGGGVILSVIEGVFVVNFLPALVFLVVNFCLKVCFVVWYMYKDIPRVYALCSGIPYLGSAFLLGFLLHKNPLFLKALRNFLKYFRKKSFRYMCKLFGIFYR